MSHFPSSRVGTFTCALSEAQSRDLFIPPEVNEQVPPLRFAKSAKVTSRKSGRRKFLLICGGPGSRGKLPLAIIISPQSGAGRSLTGCRFRASWSSDRTSARSVLRCRRADGTVLAAKRGSARCSRRQGRRGIDRRDPGSEPRRRRPARSRGRAAAARRSHPRPRRFAGVLRDSALTASCLNRRLRFAPLPRLAVTKPDRSYPG